MYLVGGIFEENQKILASACFCRYVRTYVCMYVSMYVPCIMYQCMCMYVHSAVQRFPD
jgi:hypothetical protein